MNVCLAHYVQRLQGGAKSLTASVLKLEEELEKAKLAVETRTFGRKNPNDRK